MFLKKPQFSIRIFLFLFLFPGQVLPLVAQQSNTLYLMHSVPQSNQLNPAVQIRCNFFVGIPGLNTLHMNYSNSAFNYNDLTSDNLLALDDVYNMLYRINMVSVEAVAYPISLGLKRNGNYFTFSVAERFGSYTTYSKKLAGLALYGNTQYVGEIARVNNTRVNTTYYREYSVGWSVDWNPYTTFGIRGKLLFGKANLNTGPSRVSLGTDEETFDLTVKGNVTLNSSLPVILTMNDAGAITGIDLKEFTYPGLLFNPRNPGVAADFGVIHEYSNDITLSASLLDLGLIVWTDELYNINAEVDFLYEGVQEGTDFSAAAYFRDLSDSVVNDIIYDVTQKPYISPLPAQLFLGASYQWKKHIELGIVMRNVWVNRGIKSSLTVSANAAFMKILQASLSWSYLNNSPLHFGAGLAYVGRGLQIYAVTDNIPGLFLPLDARTINLRFGMNLMLGCPKKLSRGRNKERSMVPCPPNVSLGGKKPKR